MTRVRGFEVLSNHTYGYINLPKRSTSGSAGYDFEAAEDTVVPSIWKMGIAKTIFKVAHKKEIEMTDEDLASVSPTLVPTGIKSYMEEDTFLQLANRSSNPIKNFLMMSNSIGIIDSDYYNNESNEGHIMFQFINFGLTDKVIKKGDRIGQGLFLSFFKIDDDTSEGLDTRSGGFGSTDE